MNGGVEKELIGAAHAWDRVDGRQRPGCEWKVMADDWTIIGSDGNVGDKATSLELVRSGKLTHDVMGSHDVKSAFMETRQS